GPPPRSRRRNRAATKRTSRREQGCRAQRACGPLGDSEGFGERLNSAAAACRRWLRWLVGLLLFRCVENRGSQNSKDTGNEEVDRDTIKNTSSDSHGNKNGGRHES